MSTDTNHDVYMKAAENVYTKLFYSPATITRDSDGSLVTTDEIIRPSGCSAGDYMLNCKKVVEAAILEYGGVFSNYAYVGTRDRLIAAWVIWALNGFEAHNKPRLVKRELPQGNSIDSDHLNDQTHILYMNWLNTYIDHRGMLDNLNQYVTGLSYMYDRETLLRALTGNKRSELLDLHLSNSTIHPSPYIVPRDINMPMCLSNVALSAGAPQVPDPMLTTQRDLYIACGYDPEMYPVSTDHGWSVAGYPHVDVVYQFNLYSKKPIACFTMSALDKIVQKETASRIRSTLRNGEINIIKGFRWNLNSDVLPTYQDYTFIERVDGDGVTTIFNSLDEIRRVHGDITIRDIYKCLHGKRKTCDGYIWIAIK